MRTLRHFLCGLFYRHKPHSWFMSDQDWDIVCTCLKCGYRWRE